ncbi:hypothetical protein AWC18_03605 [Mycolicibacter nonchromogenicus]|uniref:Acetone carboxylase n=1 Tax=Mycolicibacter nonchromogenicus TaxID=1782 RepID=A0A1X1ZL00_MYCNO|nr:hypothetical protein [Mycolicibacter nonchromogenicus]OBI02280.1 hypothetical protein A5715_10055 [Mycolicibacter heraklionensis]OMC16363.1 hypothetical protein A5735_08645 [Mycolicibacter heraklionensis]ORW24027.1 hypothetical protein AWC18_03605 [Mycolicibacter nonchromogenicus]
MIRSDADPVDALICSRKGCDAEAVYGMLWNNPKLHDPDRRKVWLTCPQHREYFREYLSARGLLKDEAPVEDLPRRQGA